MYSSVPIPGWMWVTVPGCRNSSCGRRPSTWSWTTARRSFARADVNTVITVAGAPGKVKEDHTVRFVAFKKPFEDVIVSENLLTIEEATTTLRNECFRVFSYHCRRTAPGRSGNRTE